MEIVPAQSHLGRLLAWCEERGASDLHLRAGAAPSVRIDGALQRVPAETQPPLDEETFHAWMAEAFSAPTAARLREAREADLSFQHGALRYRGNFSRQKGLPAASLRAVLQQRAKLSELRLPGTLASLVDTPRGVILLCGPTGQGKSTTARALLQELNETHALRVISIEDPIEFVFEDVRAEFEQREVGIDTDSFAAGIRNAMRQDPDVIFVGEVRDRASLFAAMQAAETGHLVLTTLHADSVAQALGRIAEHFPAPEQPNVRGLLARNLNAVIHQRLLPATDGGRVPCLEILRHDAGVEEAIREGRLETLTALIEVATSQGMHTFDQYLTELLAAGVISRETALQYAVNPPKLEMALRGFTTQPAILQPDRNR
jgi:twitching motility protein PilT